MSRPKTFLSDTHPHLACEWHPGNSKQFAEVGTASRYKAQWCCKSCSHIWNTAVFDRGRTTRKAVGCSACSNQVVTATNCLHAVSPQIAKEWHPDNNHLTPKQVTNGSVLLAWWVCSTCTYQWEAQVTERTRGRRKSSGCPSCAKRLVTPFNSLAVLFPELAKDWDERANGCTAEQVVGGGRKRVRWCCRGCSYKWESPIYLRTRNVQNRKGANGCPACSGKIATSKNCLAAIKPELAKELSTRNEFTAFQVTPGSRKQACWECDKCACIWKAAVRTRAAGYGCPACGGHGWNIWKLQVFLRLNWDTLRKQPFSEQHITLRNIGLLQSASPARSVIEALLRKEINNRQLSLFCEGRPSSIDQIVKDHKAVLYGGRARIPKRLREAIYIRDNHRCLLCSAAENLSLDHIWPHSKGGLDVYENLQTLCRSCNSKKNDKVEDQQSSIYSIEMSPVMQTF